jgi:PAS domain S-box-containing protein
MNTRAGNESSLLQLHGLTDFQSSGSIADFLEVAFDAIVILDLRDQITYWNPAAEQMFGWTTREALGETPAELFWPLSTSREKKTHQQRHVSLSNGAVLRGEFCSRRKDASDLWVQYTARAIFDAAGKITGQLTLFRDITVRMQLRESEERFRIMANNLPFMVWVTNVRGEIEMVNQTYEEFFGVKAEQVMPPKSWQPLLHPDEGKAYISAYSASVEEHTPFSAEVRVKRADGEWRWIASQATPRFTSNGEFLGHVGSSPDITERKEAEEALRASEQQYKLLAETLPALVWLSDSSGKAEYVNSRWQQYTGMTLDQFNGSGWEKLNHPDDRTRLQSAWEDAARKGEGFAAEFRYRRYDGKYNWFLGRSNPLKDQHGRFSKWIGVMTDISERKRVEEQLHELSQRLTYHVDNSPLAVIEWGPDMRLIRWSGAAERIFGWKADEVLGKRMGDFRWIYDEDRSQVGEVSVDLRSGRDSKRFSANRNYRKDGSVAYCEWYNSSLMDESGNLRSILSLVLDVTERKQATDALHESEKQLQLLNQSLEQKVKEKTAHVRRLASELVKAEQRERSRISHILHDDLQQRIYALQMELTVLRDTLDPENEPARKEVLDIESQMNEIRQVIRHLSVELNPPILPNEGLSQAFSGLAAHMQQLHGLSIEVVAEKPFTISDEQIHVLLFNCVRELLFNVVKHAQASHAVVSLHGSDDDLQIEVRDNGRGFPVHKESEGKNGSELLSSFGLPTIRHQLSLFGGSMRISSEPGAGTCIVLNVPLKQAL